MACEREMTWLVKAMVKMPGYRCWGNPQPLAAEPHSHTKTPSPQHLPFSMLFPWVINEMSAGTRTDPTLTETPKGKKGESLGMRAARRGRPGLWPLRPSRQCGSRRPKGLSLSRPTPTTDGSSTCTTLG